MSTVQRFETELAALLVATGHPSPPAGATTWRATSGNLEITVHNSAGRIEVDLAGWRHSFTLVSDDDGHDDDDTDDDTDDQAALALDLIGAGLFGALRICVERYNGVARRFTLQTRSDTAWHLASTQGSRPWNPLARRSGEVHTGRASERPPRYHPRGSTPLPWAPWAGLAGFHGAPAAPLPTELPVNGELDLHNFAPREIKPLVLAYVDACLARGITELRIVHGKGVGNLRRTVHALLDRHPRVKGYRLGGHGGGSWGATLVDLSPGPAADPEA
ncbi:MAG: Smr/MutS family protein [Nannocystis sp.]|nr:Smr/MutS family protein [Nannocystis sp.]MBA3549651.1 Smr/MutS family protein [Nannocystis sp.]